MSEFSQWLWLIWWVAWGLFWLLPSIYDPHIEHRLDRVLGAGVGVMTILIGLAVLVLPAAPPPGQ